MTRKKQVYLFLLSLSMMILIGCGKSTSETKEVTDGSVVVQVPEGSTVESLFDFTSTENISLSGAASGIIHVGNLANLGKASPMIVEVIRWRTQKMKS